MTDEERQRQMDFIIGTLAQLSAKVDGLADAHAGSEQLRQADAVRIGRVEESFSTVTKLLVRYDERFDETEARLGKVEHAVVTLTKILEGRG
ncbi:MAG: hypothetical protein WKF84_19000 [Pyrinomonadaceae bacterium]